MGNGVAKKDKNKTYLLETCEDHDGSINCMAISEDASVLATGSDDKTVRLWSTKTVKTDCIGVLEGHTDYITSVIIEDNYVVSSCADKTIRKWDMSTCECVLVYTGHTSTVNKVLCTGDFLFSISYDKTTRCWDFDSGECVRIFVGHKNNVSAILFIPAEKDNMNDAIKMIKSNSKKPNSLQLPSSSVKQLKIKGYKNGDDDNESEDENGEGDEDDNDDIYSKDIIITASLDSLAKSWSFETGECIYTFKGHTAAITCLAVDEFGRILFTGSSDHTIRSWDIFRGVPLKVFEGHQTTVIGLVANKKLLYSASSDHTARSWIMEFGDCTRIFKGHTHTVGCIMTDKGLVYTGCGDSMVRCFDSKSGTLQRTFKGHTGSVNCLKLCENKLFSGSFDGTLRIWDLTGLVSGDPQAAHQNKSESDTRHSSQKIQPQNETVTIENETSYSLKLNPTPSYRRNTVRPLDKRSDADSGIDDREYAERASVINSQKSININMRESTNF